jgi:hypothetical protein
MKLPEGWPTEEMIRAAYDSGCVDYLTDRSKVIKLFNVMLSAAPTPPAQQND